MMKIQIVLLCFIGINSFAQTGDPTVVMNTPGLVAFWTFGEEPGLRTSHGTTQNYPLEEVGGPIPRIAGGFFSGYSANLDGSKYFKIPYDKTAELNINGPKAQLSMFAVVKIFSLTQSHCIAGLFSEGFGGAYNEQGTRQYALLMDMPFYGGAKNLVPHISSEGGPTRRADGTALPWCGDYACSKNEVPVGEWCTLGFTYDGNYIRAYINGILDAREPDPVADKRTDRYFTKEGLNGGNRGMNPYYHGRGIFKYDSALHLATKPQGPSNFTIGHRNVLNAPLREATVGHFGGLAMFNRALSDAEMKKLHDAANLGGSVKVMPWVQQKSPARIQSVINAASWQKMVSEGGLSVYRLNGSRKFSTSGFIIVEKQENGKVVLLPQQP